MKYSPRQKYCLILKQLLWRQVTIVTSNVPAVGGDSGETRCQGDMEKADMVDGKQLTVKV